MPKKKKLEMPKPNTKRAVARKVGERPHVDLSMVPHTAGESVRANFRADLVTIADIEEHLRRLEDRAPGFVITTSDAIRSLIQEGARSYRTKFSEPSNNEPKK